MAKSTVETENKNQELKHLGFVKIAALNALIIVSNIYEYAKQNSGPLRSGVRTVEGTVTAVLGPVYQKFQHVPYDLLVFFDNKVDEAENKFNKEVPPPVKQVVSKALAMTRKASQLTVAVVSEVRAKGVFTAAADVVNKSEDYLSEQAVKTWVLLDKFPTFHMVAKMVVPAAAHWSDKYNEVVSSMAKKGYTVFSYLPLVPVEKIANAFKSA